MSMRKLQNAQAARAMMATQGKKAGTLGVVSAYDPSTYSVKVQFPPDTRETGWIPLGALAVGSGFGIYAPPNIGDQIEVRFQDGGADAGIGGALVFDNQSPPLNVPAGEVWVVHKSGTSWKLTTDGKLSMIDAAGSSIVLNNDGTLATHGTWNHTGALNVTGATAFTGTVKANSHSIDETHTHKNTQFQTGSTSGPVT